MIEGIHWLGHASFRIDDDITIYIDPWKLKEPMPADIVLVTHGHFDHLSVEDIEQISSDETVIVCPGSAAHQVQGNVRSVSPGDHLIIKGVEIDVVPAYNPHKRFHPRREGHVGYVVTVGGRRIYHAGDTDLIPEMSSVQCDVALLPIGGTYTMDASEAAKALDRIKPRVAIPMHWGDVIGSRADAERFRDLAPEGVEVIILEPESR